MSGQLLSSKVVVVEEEPKVRGIPGLPTAVAGMVGITERGPIDQAVLCTSFEEFQDRFGGFTPNSDMALAAMGFFENGGSQLWLVRTVHHTDVSDPATAIAVRSFGFLTTPGAPTPALVVSAAAEPFILDDGDRIVVSVDGGADEQATFNGSAAQLPAGGAGPFALTDGQTLTLRFDGGAEQTVTLAAADFVDIGAATADELAAAINAQIAGGKATVETGILNLSSDIEGSSSQVEVTGGTANPTLGFSTGVVSGTGNVADLGAVSVSEVKTVVEAAIPSVEVTAGVGGVIELRTLGTGAAVSLQVQAATAAAFGFDNDLHSGSDSGAADAVRVEGKDPGAYADQIQAEVRAATNGEAEAFDLAVIEDGVYRETFPNLSMDPSHARYIETIVNDERTGSNLIRVIDQLLAGHPVPDVQTVQLAGGNDGLTVLDDTDFVGSEAGKTGLNAFDQVQDLTMLLVPGRATSAVHNAMVAYCEVDRDGTVFAILDPPANQSATGIVDYVQNTAALIELTEFAAIYWPRVLVLNPAKSVFGPADKIPVPPSGIIAGVYARTDSARPGGVYDPPAGIDKGRMFGVLGFETDEVLEEARRDLVYPKRINPLTTGPGLPRYIDGSRTLKGSGNFPYVAERRGVIFIERSLKQGLQFARHKNNTEGLRAQVRRTITAFLLTQMNNGAFRSREPSKAFFVDVSETLNTPTVIFAGKLIARVGLATNKPAEFIVLRISQDTRALEAELAAAGA
ncbi:MAG: phage tail protein [Proteobacteria bacterium]|nr:MAG: phage tail protein [Pseudomonadota bacterium]